jgi:hypothetical protein
MGRGQRRVAAKPDLDPGREPAQAEAVAFRDGEGRFRQVHLGGDVLHPGRLGGSFEKADAGGIALERNFGERVDLIDRDAHGPLLERLFQRAGYHKTLCPRPEKAL